MGASTTGGQTRIGPIWSGANSPGRAGGSAGSSSVSGSDSAETGADLLCAGSWNASVIGSTLAVAAAQALTYHVPRVAPQRKRRREQAARERGCELHRAAAVCFQRDPLPARHVFQRAARHGA